MIATACRAATDRQHLSRNTAYRELNHAIATELALRRWRHNLLNVCGDGGEDCAAFTFACHCPCLAYG